MVVVDQRRGELGLHAFGFTSGRDIGPMLGGAALTPGNSSEMLSLRTEHAGALAILLVLYAFQAHIGPDIVKADEIIIWLDNTKVLSWARRTGRGENIKELLVLDYDLWAEMEALQKQLHFPIQWKKVDTHISKRKYASGVQPKGGKYFIHLNEFMDGLAGSIREATELHRALHPRRDFFTPIVK